MYCPNNRRTITKEQLSCQQSCEDDLNCVGISFSNADNESTSKLCYICIDDNLTTGANNFAFYPKPFVEYDYATEYFIGKQDKISNKLVLNVDKTYPCITAGYRPI